MSRFQITVLIATGAIFLVYGLAALLISWRDRRAEQRAKQIIEDMRKRNV